MISPTQSTTLQMQVTKRCYANLARNVKAVWAPPKGRIVSFFVITSPIHIAPSLRPNGMTQTTLGAGNNLTAFRTS